MDGLKASGLAASTVQCSILPLRAIYRRAIARRDVAMNPTTGVEVPAVREVATGSPLPRKHNN